MRLAWMLAALVALIGCAPQVQTGRFAAPGAKPGPWAGGAVVVPPGAATTINRQRVGLLLPLTGQNAALGTAMLNGIQLALFEQADPRVELLPRDTRGTPAGAADAARAALAEGATILVGPLTLGETAAAAGPARAAGAPMLSFTSDEGQAGNGVWVLGITPTQVARRLAGSAVAAGARRIGVFGADDEFGRRLAAAMGEALAGAGLPPPVVQLNRSGSDAAQNARDFAARLGTEAAVDAIVLAQAGTQARQAAQALAAAGLTSRLYGTHLWAGDAQLAQEPALAGAAYAGPDPVARGGFDNRFQQAFGERPSRLSGTAYDAAALAARAARDGGRALPVGEAFQGADGPIRLMPDGTLARGMAILEVGRGGAVREPAPMPGAAGS
ncbi:MAG: penicillin-binding protein activator [Rubritepida sp.]|nr:penicillin-binding protein activator [Rubritepida sp.]